MALGEIDDSVVWGNKFRKHGLDNLTIRWEYKLLEGQKIIKGVFQSQLGT